MVSYFLSISSCCLCRIEKPLSTVHSGPQARPGGRVPTNRSRGRSHFLFLNGYSELLNFSSVVNLFFSLWVGSDLSVGLGSGKLHSLPLSSVYTWGSGITAPLRLPMLNTEVLQVSLGRTQKMGVTKSGRLITWEVSAEGKDLGSIWCIGASS